MSYLDLVQHLDDSADGGDDTEDLPPFNTTYIKEFIPENESLVVVELLDFLPTELSSKWPEVTPMPILGDGDCLLRSISYSMWGTQRYKNKLRALLVQELKCHMEWYKRIPSKVEGADTNWDETLQEAEKNNVYLGFAHVFALSNVLGRTIVVYANDTDYKHFGGSENGVTATIFPARKIAFNEEIDPLPVIAVSWGNVTKTHFISIISVGQAYNWHLPPTAFDRYLQVPDSELKSIIVNNYNIISPPNQKKKSILVQMNSGAGNSWIIQDEDEDGESGVDLYQQQRSMEKIIQLQQQLIAQKKRRDEMEKITMRVKLNNKIYEVNIKEDSNVNEDLSLANEFLEGKMPANKSALTLFTKFVYFAQKLSKIKKHGTPNHEIHNLIANSYNSSSSQSHLTHLFSQLRKSQHQLAPNFDKKYLLVSFLSVKFTPANNTNSLSRAYEPICSNSKFSSILSQQKSKFEKLHKSLSSFVYVPSSKSTPCLQFEDYQLLFDLLSHPAADADMLFPVMDLLRIAVLVGNFPHFLNDSRVNTLYKIIYSTSGKKYDTFLYLSLMMITNLFHSESLMNICFEEKLAPILFILDKSINYPTANPDRSYQYASKIILYLVSMSPLKNPTANRLNKLRIIFLIVAFLQKLEVHIHYEIFYNLLQALGILLYHDPDLQKFLHDKVNLYYLLEEIEKDILRFVNDVFKVNPASVSFYAQLFDLGNLVDEIYELLAYPTHVIRY